MNRAEMVRQSMVDARLPVLTDQEIQSNLRSKIDPIRRNVESSFRIGYQYGTLGDGISRDLFSFTAEESFIEDVDWRKGKIGKVESDHLQQLGLEVMKEYGFDETKTKPYAGLQKWQQNDIDDPGGTSREFTLYPSQTIEGLVFERTRKYVKTTGETISVSWSVRDNAPLIKIGLGRKKTTA